MRFWAGYSWQDNSDGGGAVRPDRVTLKLDKASYRPGDTIKLHIAAPTAGKGYAMVEIPVKGRCGGKRLMFRLKGWI